MDDIFTNCLAMDCFCMDIADQQTCKTAIRQIQETTHPTA